MRLDRALIAEAIQLYRPVRRLRTELLAQAQPFTTIIFPVVYLDPDDRATLRDSAVALR